MQVEQAIQDIKRGLQERGWQVEHRSAWSSLYMTREGKPLVRVATHWKWACGGVVILVQPHGADVDYRLCEVGYDRTSPCTLDEIWAYIDTL